MKHSLIFEVNLLKEAITFLAKQKDKNGFDFLIFLIKKLHSYKYNMIPIDDLMLAAIQSLSHYDYSDNEYYAKLNDLRKYNPNSIAISEIISDAVANNSERLVSILNSQYSSITREVRLLMKLELKNHQILGQDTKNQDIILSKLFKFKIIRAISYRRKSLVEDRDWLTKKMNHEIEGSDEINSLIRSYFEDFGEIIINLITYFQISSWHPIVHDLDDGPPDRTTNVVDSKMEYSLKQLEK